MPIGPVGQVPGAEPPKPPTAKSGFNSSVIAQWGTKTAGEQTAGIAAGKYYSGIMKFLQGILSNLLGSITGMQNSTPGSILKFLTVLAQLHDLKGRTAAEWGGEFGKKMGESIKKAVDKMVAAISKDLGKFTNKDFPELGKELQQIISTGKIPQSMVQHFGQYIQNCIENGTWPNINNLQDTIQNQQESTNTLSMIMIARISRLMKNGSAALQAAGKGIAAIDKALLQMLSAMQSGG